MNPIGSLLDFIDKRRVVRRAMVLAVLWMLIDCYLWAKGFAAREGMTGAELALVIAAVTVPITGLQGFVFKVYDSSRQGES